MGVDFGAIIPRDIHEPLVWIGSMKEKWLTIDEDPDMQYASVWHVDSNAILSRPGWQKYATFVRRIINMKEPLPLMLVYAASRCIAQGPKLFKPSDEKFEAMGQVSINIPIEHFRMPYESLVVQIPGGARAALAKKIGIEINICPQFVLMHTGRTAKNKVYFFSWMKFGKPYKEVIHFFQEREVFPDIETAILKRATIDPDDQNDHEFAESVTRPCINLMLMLVHYGSRLTGPINPAEYERHRRKKSLAKFRQADFIGLDMQQDITIRHVEHNHSKASENRESDGSIGREMPPHWRRGYWRHQACGKGRADHRLVFINPVLVRADRVGSGLHESGVAYHV